MNEIIDFGNLAEQIGSMGTFILVLVIAFWYFKGKKKLPESNNDLPKMIRQIEDLWKWHSKEDDDGVKVWYVRSSLEKAVIDMTEAIRLMTETGKENSLLTRHLVDELKSMRKEIRG